MAWSAECVAQEETVQLHNSRGMEATQRSTSVDVERVLLARSGEQEVESFMELTRRQVADLQLDDEVKRQAQYAVDLLSATAPPSYRDRLCCGKPRWQRFCVRVYWKL